MNASQANKRRLWEVLLHEWRHKYEDDHGERPAPQQEHLELECICNENRDSDDYVDYTCKREGCCFGTVEKQYRMPETGAIKAFAAIVQLEDEVA